MADKVQIISDSEIAGAAKAAGFSGDALVKIVAIAIAESSGNIYAHNKIPPDNSYGLTQINMLGDMGPERRKRFGIQKNEQLFDPVTNMKAAFIVSGGGKNFRPWSTYIYGNYFSHLTRARKAAGSPASSIPGADSGTVVQAGFSSGASEFVDFFTDAATWKRVGFILAGSALIIVSLILMSGATGRAKALVNVATDVLPVGRVAKAAKAAATVKAA